MTAPGTVSKVTLTNTGSDKINAQTKGAERSAVEEALTALDKGTLRVAEKKGG